jgi:hypothetical protein
MENDKLRLIDTKLLKEISAMTDDELWDFALKNLDLAKNFDSPDKKHPKTMFFYAYKFGMEHFRKIFLGSLDEYDREGTIYTLVLDFCFPGETVKLDYYGRGGFLDHSDSCGVLHSDEIMPPLDEDSDDGYHKKFFYLLEPHHIGHIIQAMKQNFDKLDEEAAANIPKIENMQDVCLKNKDYKAVLIYDGL